MEKLVSIIMQNPFTFVAALVAVYGVFSCVRLIPNNRVGIKEKIFGAPLQSGIMALQGEAGYQPQVLRGGVHFLIPFQNRVHIVPLVTIPQGKIGYVFARDGQPLEPMQTLASNKTASDFQDVIKFMANGGQKGPQRHILREGTYAINLAQFIVITEDQVYALRLNSDEDSRLQRTADDIAQRRGFHPIIITDDLVGIVTVHDGPSLQPGEIVAHIVGDDPHDHVTYHNNFQDPEAFLAANGKRGRQSQTLVEGTYNINRLFATVEMIPKTVVEVGQVGVVVSYTGDVGADISGIDYKHGELVAKGSRGVWENGLMPGKYAFNTYAGKVIMVPTTNFILKWHRNETGAHRFDENLAEVNLITKDAFEPVLPLSVVVHIDYRKAPLVIQRFGDIKRLVDQTLDPMVAAYFKNVGQTRTLIQLIQDRSSIQQQALEEMKEKFVHYNLELEEVLIGTPGSSEGDRGIEAILTQLRSRQIAEEQVETYGRQQKASVKERELREAEARARQQQILTESEVAITVQSNQGKAEAQRAVQQREQINTLANAEAEKMRTLKEAEARNNRVMAEAEAAKVTMLGNAEASRIRATGEAEAEKTARIGIAQAIAIEEQVRAYGGPRYQLTQQVMNRFAEAIERSRVDVVPKIMLGGGGSNGSGDGQGGNNVLQSLLALMLSDRLTDSLGTGTPYMDTGGDAGDDAMRKEIRQGLLASARTPTPPPKSST